MKKETITDETDRLKRLCFAKAYAQNFKRQKPLNYLKPIAKRINSHISAM